jgi:hypothetical protein
MNTRGLVVSFLAILFLMIFLSELPHAQQIPNIGGVWRSSMGIDYQVSQTGTQFTWVCPVLQERAQGAVQGKQITATWNGLLGQATGTGTIETDSAGIAQKIAWQNGVTFTRTGPPPSTGSDGISQKPTVMNPVLTQAQPVPPPSAQNISGRWSSSIGIHYRIEQQGNAFRWVVEETGERGRGSISGETISASWVSGGSAQSTTGRVTSLTADGRPSRIDFANGIILTLSETAGPASPPPGHSATPIPLPGPAPTPGSIAQPKTPTPASGLVKYRSKSEFRREQRSKGLLPPKTIELPSDDPILASFLHAMERYVSGAPSASPVDNAFRQAIMKHPGFSKERMKTCISRWQAIPAADRLRIIPAELHQILPSHPMNMDALRQSVERAIFRNPAGGFHLTPKRMSELSTLIQKTPAPSSPAPVPIQPGLKTGQTSKPQFQMMTSMTLTTAQIGSNMKFVQGVGMTMPAAADTQPPRIDKMEPRDPDGRPYARAGQNLTIHGSGFPTVPPWGPGATQVVFYPKAGGQAIITVSPISTTQARLIVPVPAISPAEYMVEIRVIYAGRVLTSNQSLVYIGERLNTISPLLTMLQPYQTYPGRTIGMVGKQLKSAWPLYASVEPADPSYPPVYVPVIEQLDTAALLQLPVDIRPGRYRVRLTAGGSPFSSSHEFTVLAPQYRIRFNSMRCIDESDPEWYGSDEIATYWFGSVDGKVYKKNTNTYHDFETNTVKPYEGLDSIAYTVDGTTGPVTSYLVLSTELMEMDAEDAQAASDVMGVIGDFAEAIGDCFPGIGSVIGTAIKYVLKVVAWIVNTFGGEPDYLGRHEFSWTYGDLQKQVAPGLPLKGKIEFYDSTYTGRYELDYEVERFETP